MHLLTLTTLLLPFLGQLALILASPLQPRTHISSVSAHAEANTTTTGLSYHLTCADLGTLSTTLDALINYPPRFSSRNIASELSAIQSFAQSYKDLILEFNRDCMVLDESRENEMRRVLIPILVESLGVRSGLAPGSGVRMRMHRGGNWNGTVDGRMGKSRVGNGLVVRQTVGGIVQEIVGALMGAICQVLAC